MVYPNQKFDMKSKNKNYMEKIKKMVGIKISIECLLKTYKLYI